METPQPTSAKLKLWRWLLLLSVITVALGGFVWWTPQSERLQFVEPIWSDSLAGHEKGSEANGQRRKVGEVWSLTRLGGAFQFGRGLSLRFEGQYPVFPPGNAFHQAVTDELLTEHRRAADSFTVFDWSDWWDHLKEPGIESEWTEEVSFQVLSLSERAVSVRKTVASHTGGAHGNYETEGRSFVDQGGIPRAVELEELFQGEDWSKVLCDFCRMDLRRQGASAFQPPEDASIPEKEFSASDLFYFGITNDELIIFVPSYVAGSFADGELEVHIPFSKLAGHLRLDGPLRLFQSNSQE